MTQNHVLSNISCWVGRIENFICPSQSPWNEDAKIGFGLICSLNTSGENQQIVLTKKAWIHWCVGNCMYQRKLGLTFDCEVVKESF